MVDAVLHFPKVDPTSLDSLNAVTARLIYSPLEQGCIRLVIPHPSTHIEDDIQCSLQTVKLQDQPHYEALSYVWGTSQVPEIITIDGHGYYITGNLDRALRRLRLPTQQRRVLWIDVIAINQPGLSKRNIQVANMHKIYSQAAIAIAFLGEGDPSIEMFIHTLAKTDFISDREALWRLFHAMSTEVLDTVTRAFRRLGTVEYWKRVWVVQEVCLSELVKVQYGSAVAFSLILQFMWPNIFKYQDAHRYVRMRVKEKDPGKQSDLESIIAKQRVDKCRDIGHNRGGRMQDICLE
jgi:hypothetical protein